jgi:glycosyltransferase involved in cell wall biosynthesis
MTTNVKDHPNAPAMAAAPSVSVVMTCYNTARYVGDTIQSVLAQTFTDFELIAVNDGSTDGSLEILNHFAAQDQRVHVLDGPNTGIGHAARKGMAKARGEFIARIDSDDLALPTRFEKQVAYLRQHPSCVALGSRVFMVDPEGETLCEWGTLVAHDEIDHAHMNCGGPAIIQPAVMLRRDAVEAIGGYKPEYAPIEDLDLFLRLAEVGEVANLPEPLTKWRQHPRSACHTRFKEIQQLMPLVLADADRRRGIHRAIPAFSPDNPGQTAADHHLKWAWWALNDRQVSTARKHAFAALRKRPFSTNIWRAAACAMRGH